MRASSRVSRAFRGVSGAEGVARHVALLTVFFAGVPLLAVAAPPEGTVTMPLEQWSELVDDAGEERRHALSPTQFAYVDRELTGRFDKGLLEGRLMTRFTVFEDVGYLQVPVVEVGASPGAVTLNGEPTSLVRQGEFYTVGVTAPGTYSVEVRFFKGELRERFTRRLRLALPRGGTTSIAVTLPETDVEATIAGGVVTETAAEQTTTKVTGFLDANGQVDLTWRRTREADENPEPTRLRFEMDGLVTIGDGLVEGASVFRVDVIEGETDRVTFRLPPEVEVLDVVGDAVLQWRTEAAEEGGDSAAGRDLSVLLRYLIDDAAQLTIRYQYPTSPDGAELPIRTVSPPPGTKLVGALGVQAPAGLSVSVATLTDAVVANPRELPPTLAELSSRPLLLGFSFETAPTISVTIEREAEVALISTLIDELQSSTVILADGTEVTKVRLDIRNNARQYLGVTLPSSAVLTNALLDGQPVKPARSVEQDGVLLFSLRQSDRIDPATGRTHTVSEGETLGAIAHRYYSDPQKWPVISDANNLSGSIRVGDVLTIPTASELAVEESSFVLELAYRRPSGLTMGWWGDVDLTLPEVDVDTLAVTWYVYLPDEVTPLAITGNMRQLSALRFGLFERVRRFLNEAFGGSRAFAGPAKYESILKKRKRIYRAEVAQKSVSEVAPTGFSLTGTRYRFKRLLTDTQAPTLSVSYLSEPAVVAARWAAFALIFMLLLWCLAGRGTRVRRVPKPIRWAVLLVTGGSLMWLAHYVLGVHYAMLLGALAALIVGLWQAGVRIDAHRIVAGWFESPLELARSIRVRHLIMAIGVAWLIGFVIRYPRMLTLSLVAILSVWLLLIRRAADAPTTTGGPSAPPSSPSKPRRRDPVAPTGPAELTPAHSLRQEASHA